MRQYVLHHAGPVFRIHDVRMALRGVSDQTIRLSLDTLKKDGLIVADGTGLNAAWRRTRPSLPD